MCIRDRRPYINIPGSLRRHWVVALCVFLGFLALSAFVLWKRARPVYESHSVIYVSPKFPKILSSDSEVELPYDSYVQDQIQTVTRYDIIADAIAKLPYSVRHQSGPAQPSEIQALQQRLDVTRIGSSYQMSIALRGPSPDGLADICLLYTSEQCVIYRGEQVYWVDLQELLTTGSPLADLRLRRNDVIFVPALSTKTVTVMGQVQHPGEISLRHDSTLSSILGEAGGVSDAAGTNPELQIVHRSKGGKTQYIRFKDLLKPTGGMEVSLNPGDIIYVPKSGMAKMGLVLQQLGPFLTCLLYTSRCV